MKIWNQSGLLAKSSLQWTWLLEKSEFSNAGRVVYGGGRAAQARRPKAYALATAFIRPLLSRLLGQPRIGYRMADRCIGGERGVDRRERARPMGRVQSPRGVRIHAPPLGTPACPIHNLSTRTLTHKFTAIALLASSSSN